MLRLMPFEFMNDQISLHSSLQKTIEALIKEFPAIPFSRKKVLQNLTAFIQERINNEEKVLLNFICTHNSRRSHMAQLWAQAAADFYKLPKVECFSGGTEATAFNESAVTAMRKVGFEISRKENSDNPQYIVSYSHSSNPITAFSKKYDDPVNPTENFAAVMTCSQADDNCPFINGALTRIALTYDDPKEFDNTSVESEKYLERANEIGRDILFAFSKVKIDNGSSTHHS